MSYMFLFDDTQQHLTFPMKINEFSQKSKAKNEVISNTGQETYLKILVYPNGRRKENSGHVSLILMTDSVDCGIFEGVCIISIIDADRNRRFSRTFEFDGAFSSFEREKESPRFIAIERYIKNSILLENPEEFLPRDTLTMEFDIYFSNFENADYTKDLIKNMTNNYDRLSGLCDVTIDCEFGKLLCEKSEYFKRIILKNKFSPELLLKNHICVTILYDEVSILKNIGNILFDKNPIVFESIRDIIKMYVVADKYHITTVSETCLHFINLCRSDFDEELSVLADDCEHLNLLQLTKCLRNKSEGILETQNLDSNIRWSYRRHDKNLYLYFEHKATENVKQEEDEFEFYK